MECIKKNTDRVCISSELVFVDLNHIDLKVACILFATTFDGEYTNAMIRTSYLNGLAGRERHLKKYGVLL